MAHIPVQFSGDNNRGLQVGSNLGMINYYSQNGSLSQPPPSPSAIIPFRRDREFVEREVLSELWQRASTPAARVGLVGLGGVGKTQIAIEYAYRVRDQHPDTWVFWVHGSTVARFEESFKMIAERLQLAGWGEPKADILGMVYRWLSDESNGRWTMVVDNADSTDVMFMPWNGAAATQPITSTSPAPSAPVSSTDRSLMSRRDLLSAEDILKVRPMDEDSAVTLLRNKLAKSERYNISITQDDSVHLVRELDYMPLAITQAAAYINQRTPRVTISTYLEALKKSDDERGKLLQKDIRDPRRDGKASNSIMATWYISFEHIRRDRDSAARLLALMSLFDREGIPDYLLHDNYREDGERLDDFEEDIAMLRKFHLVDIGRDNIGRDNRLFDMHRLVQFSTKKWLEQHHELERWQCRYIEVLSEAFPTGKYGSWQTCQALFPHVEIMAGYQVEDEKSRQHFASVLDRGVWYGSETGRYGVAEKMARMSLQVREEGLGRDHIRSLNSVGNLARVLQEQGRYDEAEELNRRALAGCEKTLAMDHPNTLMSMENLAVVLQRQGKFDQAEELNRRALAEMEKVLGMDHPNTLNSVSNLAYILDLRQERDKALELYGRAVNGFMKVLGPAHPKTLDCQRNRSSLISRMSTS